MSFYSRVYYTQHTSDLPRPISNNGRVTIAPTSKTITCRCATSIIAGVVANRQKTTPSGNITTCLISIAMQRAPVIQYTVSCQLGRVAIKDIASKSTYQLLSPTTDGRGIKVGSPTVSQAVLGESQLIAVWPEQVHDPTLKDRDIKCE